MRISDWSSDVCSSDLWGKGSEGTEELAHKVVALADGGTANFKPLYDEKLPLFDKIDTICKQIYGASGAVADKKVRDQLKQWESDGYGDFPVCMAKTQYSRSEEHTSELQSLMRISYAVFCLKKKKQSNTTTN